MGNVAHTQQVLASNSLASDGKLRQRVLCRALRTNIPHTYGCSGSTLMWWISIVWLTNICVLCHCQVHSRAPLTLEDFTRESTSAGACSASHSANPHDR